MAWSVLIVDDSASMRKVMIKIIKMSNFQVTEFLEAENGIEGLKVCEDSDVDAILTDLNMPMMDGFAFIDNLHGDERFCDIPVVVVSTEGRATVIEQVTRMGVVEYIKKPFQPELIAHTLNKLLGNSDETEQPDNSEELDF